MVLSSSRLSGFLFVVLSFFFNAARRRERVVLHERREKEKFDFEMLFNGESIRLIFSSVSLSFSLYLCARLLRYTKKRVVNG